MEVILAVGYAAFFFFLVMRLPFFSSAQVPPVYTSIVFLMKVITGIFIGKFFVNHYGGGDSLSFFHDGNVLYSSLHDSPSNFFKMLFGIDDPSLNVYYAQMQGWNSQYDSITNDARLVIRMNALIRFFSFGYYNVHVIFFSFLSLAGTSALWKTFNTALPGKELLSFVAAFLIPSVFFWTSGVLKESLLMFALGFFLFHFIKLVSGNKTMANAVGTWFFFVLLIRIKIYVLLFLVPGLAAAWWSYHSGMKNTGLKFLTCYGIFYLIAFNIHHVFPQLDLPYLVYQKQFSMRRFALYMDAKSYFYAEPIAPYGYSLIKHVPTAIASTLLRPYPGEAYSLFLKFASAENILLVITMVIAFIFREKKIRFHHPLFWIAVFMVIHLFALTGLTTCLFGSLIRYKVPALPFLLFIAAYIFDYSRVSRFFKKGI